jgi:hypothetical protein
VSYMSMNRREGWSHVNTVMSVESWRLGGIDNDMRNEIDVLDWMI